MGFALQYSQCILKRLEIMSVGHARKLIVAYIREARKIRSGALHIKHSHRRGKVYISFYEYANGREEYLKKKSDRLYVLARKEYLLCYADVLKAGLELKKNKPSRSRKRTVSPLKKMQYIMQNFEEGGLDINRIIFAKSQRDWMEKDYKRKGMPKESVTYKSKRGVIVRSKSERTIANKLEEYGIPYRYEAQLQLPVEQFVGALRNELLENHELQGRLYEWKGGACVWNVPPRYQWMNEAGSIWRAYDGRDGTITIYPDFMILLNDGSLIIWEHEGLADKFAYRCNASERVFIMRLCGFGSNQVIATMESDLQSDEQLDLLIREVILPRI